MGPLVAITDERAGSDGDMFSHAFKLMKLGPLIGKRTWGGVIGISPKSVFVDQGLTTQPEYAFWFYDVGWRVENSGLHGRARPTAGSGDCRDPQAHGSQPAQTARF
jgi:tricorn protease